MFHDTNALACSTAITAPSDTIDAMLASMLKPMTSILGLNANQTSLAMTEEDETPDWELVKGLMSTAIDLVQMQEGIGKSLIYLELALRVAWQYTQEELANAIAKSAYLGTTDQNEWLEAAVLLCRRVLYLAAEGKVKMHRKRARAIMRNNMGVTDKAEQDRILARVQIVSLRSFYADLIKHNPAMKGGMRFFRQDLSTRFYEPTPFYLELMDWIEQAQRRADDGQAALAASDMPNEMREQLRRRIDEERIGLMVVDTFGAVWGVRSVDDEGLQAVNQRVNADGDRLQIAIPVIAHTNKSEKIDNDDHRAAGKGAVEMHSTVESTKYGRPCNDAEIKALEAKGESAARDQYLMIRTGKSNLHRQDKRPRILKRIDDGAPVCITRRIGLLGSRLEKLRDGFSRAAIKLQLCSAIEWLEQAHGLTVTANSLAKAVDEDRDEILRRYPALFACTKEASNGSDVWKRSTLMKELATEGCLQPKPRGKSVEYSFVRRPRQEEIA